VLRVVAQDREHDLEVRLEWPSSVTGSLLPARQTRLSGRQVRTPRKPARPERPVPKHREPKAEPSTGVAPAVVELAQRVEQLTAVVGSLGARMAAQMDELTRAGGAVSELRQSTDELRSLRDAIENLVTSRNHRQASLEEQLELLTREIRAFRRQVPMSGRGAPDQNLAETIGDAVRSAFVPEDGKAAPARPAKQRRRR